MQVKIRIGGDEIALAENETVLEALERHGVPMLSSCRSGICQSCMLKAEEGAIPPQAQQGLKESLRAQKYFMSCVCKPTQDMTVAQPGAALDFQTQVLASRDAGAGVRLLRLQVPPAFDWFAGQYITIVREGRIARSYSIASGPTDEYIELHVRRIPGGIISNWLHDIVKPGDPISFRGPFGDCFYTPADPDAPLLLAGTGTGLAPLYGIVRDALRQGHRGAIAVLHGALDESGIYHREELSALARKGQIEYAPCVLNGDGCIFPPLLVGSLDDVVAARPIDLKTTKAYLCGDPAIVGKMRKKLFMRGLSNKRIFADPFVSAAVVRK
ncbi:FAD-binding oxidoreductase [soil metagenome]